MSGSTTSPQGLNLAISYWLALIVLIVLLVLLAFAARATQKAPKQGAQGAQDQGAAQQPQRASPFWYVVLGQDNRVSTSKVQFALWTVALAYALLVMAFHDAVYPPGSLDPRYLLLLGFPAGAAVSAKAITTGRINNGTSPKTAVSAKGKSLPAAISEIVSDDQGDLDLGDAQYFLFNLVALTAFFIAFFHNPVSLPVLPDTLVGLTSASATAYVAKKATGTASPIALTAVSPQKGAPDLLVRVFGSGLGSTAPDNGGIPEVTMGGIPAPVQDGWTAAVVQVKVPELPVGTVDVQVVTADGRTAILPGAFDVIARPDAPQHAVPAHPALPAQPVVPQQPAGPQP